MKEIEVKIIEVNKNAVMRRLKQLGAKRLPTQHFKRIAYQIKRKGKTRTWLRLRTDGRKTTLTLKEQSGEGLMQTNEYETQVEDFKQAAIILCKALKDHAYIENTRIPYTFKGVEITIDKWPFLPYLIEIEGGNVNDVRRIQRMLSVKGKDIGNVSASKVYTMYGMDYIKVAKRNDKKLRRLVKN